MNLKRTKKKIKKIIRKFVYDKKSSSYIQNKL